MSPAHFNWSRGTLSLELFNRMTANALGSTTTESEFNSAQTGTKDLLIMSVQIGMVNDRFFKVHRTFLLLIADATFVRQQLEGTVRFESYRNLIP